MIAHDTHTENFHLVVIGHQNLEEAAGLAHGDGAIDIAVIHHRHTIGNLALLGLGLIEPDSGDFGIEKHDGGNIFVNQIARRLAKDALDCITPFQLTHVDQRYVSSEITYRINIRHRRLGRIIHTVTTIIELHACRLQPEIFGIGDTAYRDQRIVDSISFVPAVLIVQHILHFTVDDFHRLQ